MKDDAPHHETIHSYIVPLPVSWIQYTTHFSGYILPLGQDAHQRVQTHMLWAKRFSIL
jgi:hypothetical protein